MVRLHPNLPLTESQIAEFCERNQIEELYLFGSAARGEMRGDSDYDLMVKFREDAKLSLWDFVGIKQELEEMLGSDVDLIEKGTVRNPFRRASIERDLTLLYAA